VERFTVARASACATGFTRHFRRIFNICAANYAPKNKNGGIPKNAAAPNLAI